MTDILKITLALTIAIGFSACNSETTSENKRYNFRFLLKKVS